MPAVPLPPAAVRPPSAAAPEAFGRFELLELVGEGAMAQVFRARRKGPMGFAREVAIKRLRWSASGPDRKLIEALVNEARISGRLRHPGIVEVQEFDEVDGAFFLVMEFVQGWTLDKIIWRLAEAGVGLPEGAVLDIGRQVAAALAYAHEALDEEGRPLGLVHRDLKPQNLFLDPSGVVKIADFGLAKSTSNLHQTRSTEGAKGSPLYMSPEQIAGDAVDARSDLFAVGTVLAELATGLRAFEGSSIPNTLLKVLQVDVAESLDAVGRAAPRLRAVLGGLWRRHPAERPATARALLDVLDGLAGDAPIGAHSRALVAALTQAEPKGLPPGELRAYINLRSALADAGQLLDLPAPTDASLELDADSASDVVLDPLRTTEGNVVRVDAVRNAPPPGPVRAVDPKAPTAEPQRPSRQQPAPTATPPSPHRADDRGPATVVVAAGVLPPRSEVARGEPARVPADGPRPSPEPSRSAPEPQERRPSADAPTLPLPTVRPPANSPAWLRPAGAPAAEATTGPPPTVPRPANPPAVPGGSPLRAATGQPNLGTGPTPPPPSPGVSPPGPVGPVRAPATAAPTTGVATVRAPASPNEAGVAPEAALPPPAWTVREPATEERGTWGRIWLLIALCGALGSFLYVLQSVWTPPADETSTVVPTANTPRPTTAGTPTAATIEHEVPGRVGVWQDLSVEARLPAGQGGNVVIHYRPGTGGAWRQTELEPDGDGVYVVAIPVTPSMGHGVDYWLEWRDGGARRGQSGAAEAPHKVPVR